MKMMAIVFQKMGVLLAGTYSFAFDKRFKYLVLGLFFCLVSHLLKGQEEVGGKQMILRDIRVEAGLKSFGLGLGFQAGSHFQIPLSFGIGSGFTDARFNNLYFELKPQFCFRKKALGIPIGMLLGGQRVVNFENAFLMGYAGGFVGMDWKLNNYGMGLHVGYRYGRHTFVVQNNQGDEHLSAYQFYKDNPLYLKLILYRKL